MYVGVDKKVGDKLTLLDGTVHDVLNLATIEYAIGEWRTHYQIAKDNVLVYVCDLEIKA